MKPGIDLVVTGIGAVSPFGMGVSTFWDHLIANDSAVKTVEDEHLKQWAPVGARVPDFTATDYLPKKLARNYDYFTQLALIAAEEAFVDAGVVEQDGETLASGIDPERIGTSFGSAFGGIQSLEEAAGHLATGKSKRVGPRMISKCIPNAAASSVAMRYGLRGPSTTHVTACAASANAIGESTFWFMRDDVDFVLAGGMDSLWSSVFCSGLRDMGALAKTGPENSATWSRPFDKNRTGMVMGEGAAFFVLEPLEKAEARGAHIYARLAGYGASNDAYHDTAPHPDGTGAALAIQRALRSANLQASDIDYVNAHATSTKAGDVAETKALRSVFGEHLNHVPVSSIKGAVGHLLGAAGSIESIASIKAIETGILPATLHVDEKDPDTPIDVVPNFSRTQQGVRTVLSNSFGFGGQNGALIWQAVE